MGLDRKKGKDPEGYGARQAAREILVQVLRTRHPLDEVLSQVFSQIRLEERDAVLAKAIVMAVLRRKGTLERVLRGLLRRGVPGEEILLPVLQVAAAQIVFLNVPDRAAVDLAVTMAHKDKRLVGLSGLVNGVLRTLCDSKAEILQDDSDLFLEDTPLWLREGWELAYGSEIVRAIAQAHQQEPSVDISSKSSSQEERDRLAAALPARILPTGSLRLMTKAPLQTLAGFAEGHWWVQDAASALPAKLLRVQKDERIADLCAAPGGKTAQLAAYGANVTAIDRSATRMERVRENLARLSLEAHIHVSDALTFEASPFDGVLLDAPCSATGTIRRHPDLVWTKTREDIAKLVSLQSRLLDKAASLTRPGGRLVYCTCSLEKEEGEGQIEAFLLRHPDFQRDPVLAQDIGGQSQWITAMGDLRTLPCKGIVDPENTENASPLWVDGFFAVRLVRAHS
jgi:16S rRNA (cytosine967-C5)-methyltransferase